MPVLFHFSTAGLSLKSSSKARLVSTTAALQPRFNKLLLLTSVFLIASAQGFAKSDSKREGEKGRVRGKRVEQLCYRKVTVSVVQSKILTGRN